MLKEFELASIMSRPDLPQIAESIVSALRDEQVRRERFRKELTADIKAEFIAGEIVLHSPAKAKHLRITERLLRLLATYVQAKSLGEVFSEKALICLTRNDYEPDICFFGVEKAAAFNGDTMQFPAPDFIVEVLSDSTAHRDRGVKYDDYSLHAVKEYWIVDCDEQTVEQYLLSDGETQYRLARKLAEGDIQSSVVAGFRIPVTALFDAQHTLVTLKKLLSDIS